MEIVKEIIKTKINLNRERKQKLLEALRRGEQSKIDEMSEEDIKEELKGL